MGHKIVIVGAGAVGGYAGAHMVQAGEDVISVVLAASPYHVALHISGMDDPLPSVSWMGGRRLEFHLSGL